jgi:HAD superfamily hydrolase (TIGR01509 family)
MIRAVIFDCDGTIVDSRHLIIPFYNWLFAEVGLPPIDTDDVRAVEICLGLPDDDVFAHFAPDPDDRRRIVERLSQLDPADFVGDLRLEPHALEVLSELRSDYLLAIATNRGRDMTALVRHFGFDDYVDTVVTAHDVLRPKPSPDMLLLAAERMGILPAEALYVGDTDVDGYAAEAAGMQFLCYRRDPDEECDSVLPGTPKPAGTCLGDLRELPPYLTARNSR